MFNLKESDINIRPPDKIKKEGIELENEDILQRQFNTLLVGVPGSGKSHLLNQLVINPKLYYRKFNFVFLISPTKVPGFVCNEVTWNESFDLNWIFQRIKLVNELKKQDVQVLFIFDDVIGEIRKEQYNPAVKKLFFNRRHLIKDGSLSLITTTQRYMVAPPVLRTALTSMYIFKINK